MRAHRHAPKHNFTRVVFLDVDGVLNSAAEHAAGSDYIPVGSGGLWLERNLLLRLRDLLHVGQAHVVVSSSWRREQAAIEALKIACAQVGIALWRFIGQTCEIRVGRTAASRRVAEIQAYLRCSAQLGVQQWVALDDMDLASQCPQHLRKNMIRTDPHHGLQPEQVQAALQVFGLSENRWESPPQGKGIILDIDGTLIDTASHSPLQPAYSQEALAIYGRPHLQTFLDFCFENFAGVALWSTSDEEWCKLVVDKEGHTQRGRPAEPASSAQSAAGASSGASNTAASICATRREKRYRSARSCGRFGSPAPGQLSQLLLQQGQRGDCAQLRRLQRGFRGR
ncbi:unnamed protein product [Effrenium voratum]|uniref:FCP1 homology domain-containing protein n=1 Tax=Effrenium voratum TaxID=2562239 RepID=A0AA36J7Q7_9DINO|nr:unnamed protein product [Effrenium voratum]